MSVAKTTEISSTSKKSFEDALETNPDVLLLPREAFEGLGSGLARETGCQEQDKK